MVINTMRSSNGIGFVNGVVFVVEHLNLSGVRFLANLKKER